MHWSYRTIRHEEDGSLGIYEVFFDDAGRIEGYSENPVLVSEDREGLNECIKMLLDALASPVLDEADVESEMFELDDEPNDR